MNRLFVDEITSIGLVKAGDNEPAKVLIFKKAPERFDIQKTLNQTAAKLARAEQHLAELQAMSQGGTINSINGLRTDATVLEAVEHAVQKKAEAIALAVIERGGRPDNIVKIRADLRRTPSGRELTALARSGFALKAFDGISKSGEWRAALVTIGEWSR